MTDPQTVQKAQQLTALHTSGDLVVLPTVWDVWSARVAVDAGFAALTIGSHPLADSRGGEDGEKQTLEEVLEAAGRIVAAVDVPVSLDLESGYGKDPQVLVDGLLSIGAVGTNLEDTLHLEGGRLRSTEEHAAFIGGVRAAADAAGVPLVINGRTDLFKANGGDHAIVLEEGIAKLRALVAAGADAVYPVTVFDDETIAALVAAVDVPVNVTGKPATDSLERLRSLGVRRVTFGPLLQKALTAHTQEILQRWS